MSVAEQHHPDVQALLWEAARRAGAALVHLSALLDTTDAAEEALTAGLSAVSLGLDDQRALAQLRQELRRGRLRERWQQRLHATIREARYRHRRGEMPITSASGQTRWVAQRDGDLLALLGIIGGVLICYYSIGFMVGGILLTIIDPTIGILIALLGAAMFFGGFRMVRRSIDRRREIRSAPRSSSDYDFTPPPPAPAPPVADAIESYPLEDVPAPAEAVPLAVPAAPPAAQPVTPPPSTDPPLAVITVSGEIGWVRTGVAIRPGWRYTVQAIGTTATSDVIAAHGPEGDATSLGGTSHWMAGVPEGMLVGKVGTNGLPFPIGASGDVPERQQGALMLAVNTAPDSRRPGALIVKVYGRAM